MTNPYESARAPSDTLAQRTSRGIVTYALVHLVQVMVAMAWVYIEPKQVITNQTLLLFGEICFAASGFFILIGLSMIVRAVFKSASISFWMIDLLFSSIVFILGLPAVA
jgi:cytochrome bd-type quinol oxidase subunit 2